MDRLSLSALLDFLFLEQTNGAFASFFVEIDLAVIALFCHFALVLQLPCFTPLSQLVVFSSVSCPIAVAMMLHVETIVHTVFSVEEIRVFQACLVENPSI